VRFAVMKVEARAIWIGWAGSTSDGGDVTRTCEKIREDNI